MELFYILLYIATRVITQWVMLQVDFASVRDDEHFLFDSDTDTDFQNAVMTPPLDLEAMAQDGKGPVDKPTPQPVAATAVAAEKKVAAGEPAAAFEAKPTEGAPAAAAAAQDVVMNGREEAPVDLDQPAKRAKTGL